MQLQQINRAIAGLCLDVEDIVKPINWFDMSEEEILNEMLICILGSGVRYEIAVAYSDLITSNKILNKRRAVTQIELVNELAVLLSGAVSDRFEEKSYKSYRYPNAKAKFIAEAYSNVINCYGSFKKLFENGLTARELRREIVAACPGIGPKQASHFLKNVGYTDSLAILDRHIVHYIKLSNKQNITTYQLGKIDKYEDIEDAFINIIKIFEHSVSVVDQAMWFIMRNLNYKVAV